MNDSQKRHAVGVKILELMESEGLDPVNAITLIASMYISMAQTLDMPEDTAKDAMNKLITALYQDLDEQPVTH